MHGLPLFVALARPFNSLIVRGPVIKLLLLTVHSLLLREVVLVVKLVTIGIRPSSLIFEVELWTTSGTTAIETRVN